MSVVRALRLAESPSRIKRSPARRRPWQNVSGMEPRTLEYVSIACGGELDENHGPVLVRRICTDSRRVRTGDLFVALRGERFNGHDFLKDSLAAGAAAVMIEASVRAQSLPCPRIIVADTRRALGRLAACYRADFDLPIVAVGGSNGKTTTKEILRSVLSEKMRVLCSEASFNNDVGVPTTLLQMNAGHEVAVLEVGTNHPGELAPLVEIIQPRYGIITNLGREHLEFFGDMAGVAEEEGWLAESLPAYGKLFINGDSEWRAAIEKRCAADIVRVGVGRGNDWQVQEVTTDTTGIQLTVAASIPDFSGKYRLHFFGRHQAVNAAFALALGAELGLTAKQCRRGLSKCRPVQMRLQVWEQDGVHILDDSYNANVDSMLAGFAALKDFPCSGRRIAALGDMAELGTHTVDAHREIGRRAIEFGIEHLLAVGQQAAITIEAARSAGLKDVTVADDIATMVATLRKLLRPGDAVLVKASRSSGLDRVGDALGRPGKGHA
jgi:UDP-N-acetylmuramoyl-tripeptide--D-alanyl-D-alanine ligase